MPTLNPTPLILSTALMLSACANPAGITPKAQVLDPARLGLETSVASAAAASEAPGDQAWWRAWGDAQLDGLVATALADHPNLRVLQARVQRAEAAAQTVQSQDGPQVQAAADATRQKFSRNFIYPPPLGGSIRTLADLQLGASWELDFFGRNRAALTAALGQARAAQAEVQAARNALAAGVARQYAQLARLGEQRRIAERQLAQKNEMFQLIQQRVKAGLDTQLELRNSDGSVADARAQLEQIDEQMNLVRHSLAALTTQTPDALKNLQARLPSSALPLPRVIPADLLARRADISASRWRVESAVQDVSVARSAFYPNINLTALVGLSSLGMDSLLKTASQQGLLGPAIHLPLFDSGRLQANLRGRTADLDAAIEAYNGAVIEALHEVADPLTSLQALSRQQTEQAQALAAAEAAQAVAISRFQAGLTGRLVVLNAESALLAQQRAQVELMARQWDAQIMLAKALGGGFASPAPAPIARR